MGFAGLVQGTHLFGNPSYVDPKKAPGDTPVPVDGGSWWVPYVTGEFIYASPNLVWLIMAVLVYFVFPYDGALRDGWSVEFFLARCAINGGLVVSFFGFWHVTLYWLGWAKRPFLPNREYRWSKLVHNLFYSLVGAFIWTCFECLMIQAYHLGRVPYISNGAALSSWKNAISVFSWIALAPLVRDLHFYHAHVFIHLKAVYRHVHSLHHRNVDIEPFAGLCMHPVEHLYYYSCAIFPLFMFPTSPFAMLWVGQHALLAPAASHSGWEDHWQSDLYHYIHHRYTNANFGVSNVPWDSWLGTVRTTLTKDNSQVRVLDSKATLGVPDVRSFLYMASTVAIFGVFGGAAVYGTRFKHLVALVITLGSLVVAFVMELLSRRLPDTSLAQHLLSPHHENAAKLAYYIISSSILVLAPIYYLAILIL